MHEQNLLAETLPEHLGFIIDGNRRWAKEHGLPAYEGHLAGYTALKDIVIYTLGRGVKYVSLYAFSTENWKRDAGEVSNLMKLTIRVATTDIKELIEHNIRVRFLGIKEGLSDKVIAAMENAEQQTKHLTGGTALVCFNYGGHREIADAARKCLEDGLSPAEITEQAIAERLYAPDIPPVDMVVRTSGEKRISNFMLWRVAYSEFMFLDKYWPIMTKTDVEAIIKEYSRRQRRFGGN